MYIDIILTDENMISFDEFTDFDYKINSSPNNELIIGSVSAASLKFSIWNADKKYNVFRFKKGICHLYKDEARKDKIGEFKIDKITRNRNTLDFECTDYMTNLDVLFKGIHSNFTIWELLVQICFQTGIKLRNSEASFSHLTYVYSSAEDLIGKKCRDIIKWIGEIVCKYAIFDEEGKLYFDWYDLETIKKEIPYNKLKELQQDEEETIISGVSILIDKEEEVSGNSAGYLLKLSTDNPLLKPLTKDQRKVILDDINSKVNGMTYLSCDLGLAVDDEIEIGDTLKIYDEDGDYYKIIVSYININKIFSMKITSSGENLNRSVNDGTNSSGSSSSDRTYIAKDENVRDISFGGFNGETFLNDIILEGVSEKSVALITYSINFNIDVQVNLKFRLYINDILSKEFIYTTIIGNNIFNWTEAGNIKLDESKNVIKIVLDTTDITLDYNFSVEKEKSVLSVVSVGASAGAGNISSLEFKEEFKRITLIDFNSYLNIKEFEENIEILNQPYKHGIIREQIALIGFNKYNTSLSIENINENKIIN